METTPCDFKTETNTPIWQLFWSNLDLLHVQVPGHGTFGLNHLKFKMTIWTIFEIV